MKKFEFYIEFECGDMKCKIPITRKEFKKQHAFLRGQCSAFGIQKYYYVFTENDCLVNKYEFIGYGGKITLVSRECLNGYRFPSRDEKRGL